MTRVAFCDIDNAGGGLIKPDVRNVFRINGFYIALKDNPVESHANHENPHRTAVMDEGSAWFKINGVPVVLEGHLATCGHPATGLMPWFNVPY